MSQAPPPTPEMIREVDKPPGSRRTWYAVAVFILPEVLKTVDALLAQPDILSPQVVAWLRLVQSVALVAGIVFARSGGVTAAATVLRKTRNESGRHLQ